MPEKSNKSNKSTKSTIETKEKPKSNQSDSRPDESQLKTISAVGYLGILFLLPYLMYPKEKFAVFHANQSLILLISAVIVNIAGGAIPLIGWFIILPAGNIFCLVLFVIGLINALNGKMKRLPVIGGFDLLTVQK